MGPLVVILVAIPAFIAIGLLIFLPLRWLMVRRVPPEQKRKVNRKDVLAAMAVVATLLPLAWLMEAGNRYAAVIWSCAVLVASVTGVIVLNKRRR